MTEPRDLHRHDAPPGDAPRAADPLARAYLDAHAMRDEGDGADASRDGGPSPGTRERVLAAALRIAAEHRAEAARGPGAAGDAPARAQASAPTATPTPATSLHRRHGTTAGNGPGLWRAVASVMLVATAGSVGWRVWNESPGPTPPARSKEAAASAAPSIAWVQASREPMDAKVPPPAEMRPPEVGEAAPAAAAAPHLQPVPAVTPAPPAPPPPPPENRVVPRNAVPVEAQREVASADLAPVAEVPLRAVQPEPAPAAAPAAAAAKVSGTSIQRDRRDASRTIADASSNALAPVTPVTTAAAPVAPAPAPASPTPPAVAGRVEAAGAQVFAKAGPPSPWASRLAAAAVADDPAALDRLLLAPEGSVDAVDARGRSALWLAVQAGRTDSVRRLRAAGADPRRADAEGTTPLALARTLGREDLVTILAPPRP